MLLMSTLFARLSVFKKPCKKPTRGRVVKPLDPRSRGLGFNSCSASHVQVLGKLCVYTASVHPAVMGTMWYEKLVLCEWLKAAENVLHSPQADETVKE